MLIAASCHPPVPILCTSTTEKRRQDTSSLVRRVIQVGTSYSLLKVAVIRYVKVLISRMDSNCGHRTFVRGGSGDTSILRSPCQPFTPILRSGDNSTGRFLYSAIRGSLQSDSRGCSWWSHFKNVSLTYFYHSVALAFTMQISQERFDRLQWNLVDTCMTYIGTLNFSKIGCVGNRCPTQPILCHWSSVRVPCLGQNFLTLTREIGISPPTQRQLGSCCDSQRVEGKTWNPNRVKESLSTDPELLVLNIFLSSIYHF